MAIFNATSLIVEVAGVAVAHATDATLSLEHDLVDGSSKSSSGWKDVISGQRSWSLSCSALQDYASTYGAETAFDAINGRTSATVTFTTNVSGDIEYSGTAYVASLTQNAPLEDVATWEVEFTGSGALAKATVA